MSTPEEPLTDDTHVQELLAELGLDAEGHPLPAPDPRERYGDE